jgi:hypothetical protein
MQRERTGDILTLAEQEDADAVMRAADVDPLAWRTDPPMPLPPIPPGIG